MAVTAQPDDRYAGTLTQAPPWFMTRDGYLLTARLIRPDDADLLLEFFERLSSETRRRRFHIPVDHISDAVKRDRAEILADVDNLTAGGAVLALDEGPRGEEQIVGVVRLARPAGEPTSPEAEAAVVVRDDFQGRGVGVELLRRMVLLAKQMGVRTVVAIMENDNTDAHRLFRGLNLPTEVTTSHGETDMRITMPR